MRVRFARARCRLLVCGVFVVDADGVIVREPLCARWWRPRFGRLLDFFFCDYIVRLGGSLVFCWCSWRAGCVCCTSTSAGVACCSASGAGRSSRSSRASVDTSGGGVGASWASTSRRARGTKVAAKVTRGRVLRSASGAVGARVAVGASLDGCWPGR